jgi:hypothetical protein
VDIVLKEGKEADVTLEATRPAEMVGDQAFSVEVSGAFDDDGLPAPSRAEVTVNAIDNRPDHANDPSGRGTKQDKGEKTRLSDVQTGGDSGSDSSAEDQSVSIQDHEGSDTEHDYQGGVWARSEDPPDWDLTMTEMWLRWGITLYEVTSADVAWRGQAWDIFLGSDIDGSQWSKWKIDSVDYWGIDWSGTTAAATVTGDYYNWTWMWDHNKTTAYHWVGGTCNPDGSLDWKVQHNHQGEDADLLRVDAGSYGTYRNPENPQSGGRSTPWISLSLLEFGPCLDARIAPAETSAASTVSLVARAKYLTY